MDLSPLQWDLGFVLALWLGFLRNLPTYGTALVLRTTSPVWAVILRSSGANVEPPPTKPPMWNLGSSLATKTTWAAPAAPMALAATKPNAPSNANARVIPIAVLIAVSLRAIPLRTLNAISVSFLFSSPNRSKSWTRVPQD